MGLSAQFQQQQQRFRSNGSLPRGGLSALLAEDGAATASAFQASMLHHAHTAPGAVGPVSPMAGMQQQQQFYDQQQQQQEPQYDVSAVADCPDLLLKLKELPGPAVQQVGWVGG
jgi:hypothetical protein